MMSSVGNTHWCYHCRQPVRPRSRGTFFLYCDGGFVQQLSELSGGYNSSYDLRDGPDQLFAIIEASESLMIWSNPEHRLGLIEALDTFMGQRRRYGIDSDRNTPWLIFQGQILGRMPMRAMHNSRGFEMFLNGNPRIGLSRGNNGDLFVEPGLHDLIEQLMLTGKAYHQPLGQ